MNLNPTPLEVLILVLVSLSIYVWMRHGSAILRWSCPRLFSGVFGSGSTFVS